MAPARAVAADDQAVSRQEGLSRRPAGPRRHHHAGREGRVRLADRPLRRGQEHAAQAALLRRVALERADHRRGTEHRPHHAGRRPVPAQDIGVVFQDFKLLDNRTVLENVGYALEVLGVSDWDIRDRSLERLEQVGLKHKALSLPKRLSGGEQQRVAIARALVNEPTILLADEPTGNLDPGLTASILQLLFDANARGTTVIVATHDRTLLTRYHKRTIALDKGRLVSDA